MSRPAAGYRARDGKRVPGVTTITGRFKESGGLIHWAWSEGIEGRDYRQTRDEAANAGTLAHDMIESFLLQRDFAPPAGYPPEIHERAIGAYDAFRTWADQTKIVVTETERSYVSEEHRYGGTLDAIGLVNGALCLVDWKTSNRIYADYLVQIAAYRALREEVTREHIEGFHLLRVGKELGDFHHHYWPAAALEPAWEAFQLMRRLYDLDAVLKRAVG